MIYSDLFTIDSGIAAIFSADYADAFSTIFGDTSASVLDVYTYTRYSNTPIMPYITSDNYADIISAIIAVNVDVWLSKADLLSQEYNSITAPYKVVTRETTGSSNTTDNNTTEILNKVYNDDEYNGNEQRTNSGGNTRSETGYITESTTGYKGNYLYSEVIQKELELKSINLKRSVLDDIVNEIRIYVY